MFIVPPPTDALSQGDLIADCPLVGFNVASMPVNLDDPPTKWWTVRVIVLTQSCDLAQGKAGTVLVAAVHDAQQLVDQGVLKGSAVRDHVRRHLVFGWYFLPASTSGASSPEMLVDLCSFRAARPIGTVNCRRQARGDLDVAIPRASGTALCRHVHARRVAGALSNTTVTRRPESNRTSPHSILALFEVAMPD
jgi:hypothetical protein